MRFRRLALPALLLIPIVLWPGLSEASGNTSEILQQSLDKAKELEKQIVIPKILNDAAKQSARAMANRLKSQEWQARIERETKRVKRDLFGKQLGTMGWSSSGRPDKSCQGEGSSLSGKLYILVSSSMPAGTLRQYMKAMDVLHDPNVVMVLRGFVGGMKRIQPTMDFLGKLLAVDPGCKLAEGEKCQAFRANIEIDPLVFRRLGVNRVPAIAYVSRTSGTSIDQGSGSGPGEIDASVVYGDVNLTYALEKLYKDTGDEGLREAAESLRSGYYHN